MVKSIKFPRIAAALCGLFMASGCATLAARQGGDIIVIGDSIMAWNRFSGAAISDVLADQLEREVTALAVAGAQFDNSSALASAVGFDIQAQYPGGNWNWVVLNGGANDMGFGDCGCGDCSALVDRLISLDGRSGVIPAFLARVAQNKSKILWLGYYNSPGTAFAGCADDLEALESRIKTYLSRTPDGYFVEGEAFLNKNDPSHFFRDQTHPSPKGSALLGTALARVITRAEQRSQTR